MTNFTDEERKLIAEQQYKNWNVNDEVTVNGGKTTIGYVSKVVNNKNTGEQAYIITDGNPKVQKLEEVNHVTVLFQGSTGIDKIGENPKEVKRDWLDNNAKILNNINKSYRVSDAILEPTKQMKSSAETLNNAMNKYSNATFDIYGHSQSSTNGQYALGSLDSKKKLNRINGAFFYQGPNAYCMMDKEQRKMANRLKDRIFNFVDDKDLVPIGYELYPNHIGTLIYVNSKKVGKIDQHMWGGYQFKNGELNVSKESLKQFRQAKHAYNMRVIKGQLTALERLKKKLTKSGGGLSSGERIYLEDSRALAVVSHASAEFEAAMLSVVRVYQKGIQEAEKLWTETLTDARTIGVDLSEGEILSALESVGCSKQDIVAEPTNDYKEKIHKAKTMNDKFRQLAQEIRSKINTFVQKDQELSKQLKGLVS